MKKTILFSLAAILFAACSTEDADKTADFIAMPITLAIPATDMPVETRAGDPGTYEKFELPKYGYIYIVCKDDNDNDVVVGSTPTLEAGNWKKEKYDGTFAESGDSIYRYTGDIRVYLPINRQPTGKVYAAVSTVPLNGLPTGNGGAISGATESAVTNYAYELTDDVRDELQNIYSTPYNYHPDGTNYYGTMNNFNSITPSLNIVLYHVASKLDVLWNVSKSQQSTVAIKSMTLSLPDATESYIFKPLETVPTTTRDYHLEITVGNQWYGRDYRYVVPMTGDDNTYSFTTTITTTGGNTRTSTFNAGTINKNSAFTPWMRGTIEVGN